MPWQQGQGAGGGRPNNHDKEEAKGAAGASAKDNADELVRRISFRPSARIVSVLGSEVGLDTATVVWSEAREEGRAARRWDK